MVGEEGGLVALRSGGRGASRHAPEQRAQWILIRGSPPIGGAERSISGENTRSDQAAANWIGRGGFGKENRHASHSDLLPPRVLWSALCHGLLQLPRRHGI